MSVNGVKGLSPMQENVSTTISALTPSWVVIALVGAAIVACAVLASLFESAAAINLQVGP